MRHYSINSMFFVLFVLVAFASNAQKITNPLQMINYLTSITDTVNIKGQAWGKKVGEVVQNGDFASLAPIRKDALSFIEGKEKELKLLKDIAGSEPFRLGIIEFLGIEKALIIKAFVPFEKLTVNSTDEEMHNLVEQLTNEAGAESKALAKIQNLQKEFAKLNGVKIDNGK